MIDFEKAKCGTMSPDVFFPDDDLTGRELIHKERIAKAVCASCEIQLECRRYACQSDIEYGIWGGMNYRERRRWGRQQRSPQIQLEV